MNSAKNPQKRRALGRGLDSILPEVFGDRVDASRGVTMVSITLLSRNPAQTRQNFSAESLAELAQTMKEHGVLQPLIVRPQTGGRYEIVAGERRWRAAQLAGLPEVPVLVKQLSEKQAAEINLIENIQREDLNSIEEAEAFRNMVQEHGYTHEELAQKIGRSRTAITNVLRLLELPLPVQEMIRTGKLSEGHGRALLRVEKERQRIQVAMEVAGKGLSVREAEKLAARISKPAASSIPRKASTSPETRDLCGRLQKRLGTKVDLKHRKTGSGRLEIYYRNLDELDRILALIFK